jgi:hypothetical protein
VDHGDELEGVCGEQVVVWVGTPVIVPRERAVVAEEAVVCGVGIADEGEAAFGILGEGGASEESKVYSRTGYPAPVS